jgi:hypothetical protein
VDALLVIHHLNVDKPSGGDAFSSELSLNPRLDVNGDGHVSPVDALLVIANLNSDGEGEGEGEGGGGMSASSAEPVVSETLPAVPVVRQVFGAREKKMWVGQTLPTGKARERFYSDSLEEVLDAIADDVQDRWEGDE